jgi:hypothetical protein
MSVACLYGLWLDNFVRSSLRCKVAFSSSSLQKRCVYPQLDIKGASICCSAGEEDMLVQSLNKGLMAQAYL